MDNQQLNVGFSYFSAPEFSTRARIEAWFPFLHQIGGSTLILEASFDRAIPEDVFQSAHAAAMEPVVHFKTELPSPRRFNDWSLILDTYKRWGLQYVILGDKPNAKQTWSATGWRYDHLVDHFLDRLVPLANFCQQIELIPILAPLQPGGDYWDTAFIELIMKGLKRRHLATLFDSLCLSAYGYTYDRSLNWGAGGPEHWTMAKPYLTPDGQQDQLGFQNFEWIQAVSNRVIGKILPTLILDAGNSGFDATSKPEDIIENIQLILSACRSESGESMDQLSSEGPLFNNSVLACTFSLDTLADTLQEHFTFDTLSQIFGRAEGSATEKFVTREPAEKCIEHYLLLPAYDSGVSDMVLNKVRPVLKQLQPTLGFSTEEAQCAKRVTVYPDPVLFPDEVIRRLRASGCSVDILPETGIEIATYLQTPNQMTEKS